MPLQIEVRDSTIQKKKNKRKESIGARGFVIKIKFVPKFKFCHSVENLTNWFKTVEIPTE